LGGEWEKKMVSKIPMGMVGGMEASQSFFNALRFIFSFDLCSKVNTGCEFNSPGV
jgi:hypothetical protein